MCLVHETAQTVPAGKEILQEREKLLALKRQWSKNFLLDCEKCIVELLKMGRSKRLKDAKIAEMRDRILWMEGMLPPERAPSMPEQNLLKRKVVVPSNTEANAAQQANADFQRSFAAQQKAHQESMAGWKQRRQQPMEVIGLEETEYVCRAELDALKRKMEEKEQARELLKME